MPNESELQEINIHARMELVDRKILIMSGKGGVGKSTVTVNLANALLAKGFTVGVLDTDIHGPNIPKMFGCEGAILQSNEDGTSILPVCPRDGLKVVSMSFALNDPDQAIIFRGPMKLGVIKQFLADVEWGSSRNRRRAARCLPERSRPHRMHPCDHTPAGGNPRCQEERQFCKTAQHSGSGTC